MLKQLFAIGLGISLSVCTYAGTLDHVRETGTLKLGYQQNGQPYSYAEGGTAAGFAVELCKKVADRLKADAGLVSATVQWIPVSGDGLDAVQQGAVDLLCAASPVSLGARTKVSFSAPIFPGGMSAVMSVDAPERLKALLEERPAPYKPLWRGTPPPILDRRTFVAVRGSEAEKWLSERIDEFKLNVAAETVDTYATGITGLVDGDTDVLFAERGAVLDAVAKSASAKQVVVLSTHFDFRALAFALPRNDDDFRLAVDRALTEVYMNPDFGALYATSFGEPDPYTVEFFRATAVPK